MAPNILFIMCDQLRADCVEPEAADVKTPAIASLAREGLWSSNCFTNAPECIPARASLITGLYPHQSGITFNQPYTADVARPNWLQAIRAAGYHTSLFGKTHLHVTRGNMSDYQPWLAELGFDTANECGGPRELAIRDCELTRTWREAGLWDSYRADFKERFETVPHMVRPSPLGVDHYYDVFVAQRAKQFLETYESKQPFFCHVSFPGPHEPYDAPEPYASLYDPAKMKPAIRRPDNWRSAVHSHMDTLINEPNEHNPGLTDDMIGRLRANYAGSVTLIDDQIAELIAVLKAKGVYEETMIVLTSDHGELNGDFGLLRKQVFLDPAVRIPLVIKPARSQDAARVRGRQDAIIELMDVGPTLAEAAGGDLSFPGNGLSVMPLVRGERDHHRPYAHSAFRNDTMIVTQAFKTVLNERGDVSWMFDRPGDPDEQNNLALKHEAETVAERPASFWRSLFAKA